MNRFLVIVCLAIIALYCVDHVRAGRVLQDTEPENVPSMDDLLNHRLIPDLLDDIEIKVPLRIQYDTNDIQFGSRMAPEVADTKPKLKFNADSEKYYAIIMIDIDAPSAVNPTNRDWLHFLSVNVKGKKNGNVIKAYKPPTPPKGTGYHRYVFILCEQKKKIKSKLNDKISSRAKFNTKEFIQKYKLKPVGLMMFYSENEDDVNKIPL